MWLCSGIVPTPVSCPTGGPSLKNALILVYAFSLLWLQMLYLTLRGETLQYKCVPTSGVCACGHVCICMCTHVFMCKSRLSATAKNTEHFICAGNQGHHMLAFLGPPKNYITAPEAKRAGSGPAVGHISNGKCQGRPDLEGNYLPAYGMFPALGFKQQYSEVECSVENNLSPCFVLGTYQGEPWP